MQFWSPDILSFSSDLLPEDDIDRLFQKLQRLEAPQDIVKQVLARLKRLPPAQRHPQNTPEQPGTDALDQSQDISGSAL